MFDKQVKQEKIAFLLAVLSSYIENSTAAGLLSITKSVEECIAELVNVIKGYQLDTEGLAVNLPGIDALDENKKIGLQISHENTSRKVNDTLESIEKNRVNEKIDILYIFMTKKKQTSYSIKAECKGVSFNKSNILDFDDLKKLLSVSLKKTTAAYDILTSAMPTVSGDGKEHNKAMLDCMYEARNQLEREVFKAGFHAEDPGEMLDSFKEMRIALQRSGIITKANKTVSESFTKIIKLIRKANDEVAEKYNEGYKRYKAGVVPAWTGCQYSECICILMGIRSEVGHQVVLIDNEIKKYEKMVS